MKPVRVVAIAVAATFALLQAASAALPPHAYERARANAPNVVTIEVISVEITGDRACAVTGKVATVERGEHFSAGDTVTIAVPCTGHVQVTPMVGAVIWQRTSTLQESQWARAYLDNDGALALYQYEILTSDPRAPAE